MVGVRLMGLVWLALGAVPSFARAEPPTLQSALGNPDDFKLWGSFRLRYEVLDGQPRVGLPAEDRQLAVRTTLAAEYRRDALRLGAELYDSRAYWGAPDGAVSSNEVNAIELIQAYAGVELGSLLAPGSMASVQLGRMTLNLGSRRLVAADDFRNTTNGYTGIRADMKARDGTSATLVYVLPQERLPDDLPSLRENRAQWDRESFDLSLWGGFVARPRTLVGGTAEIGYIRLQERDAPGRPNRNRNLHSVSARLIRDPQPGRLDFETEGIYQFGAIRAGTAPDAPELAVDAWFLHLDAGYTLPGPAKLRLSIEYDRASGDGPGRGFGRFDTLFGLRRAELGPSGIYSAVGRANLSTPGVRVEVAPGQRFDAFAGYRAMWLAERTDAFSTTGVRDATGRSGSFAGRQIEARVRYWLLPGFLRAEVNGAWLAKGRFLRTAPNAPATGDTRYLTTGLTATF